MADPTITITLLTPISIRLSWTGDNGDYEVWWKSDHPAGQEYVKLSLVTGTTYDVGSLSWTTTYYFKIRQVGGSFGGEQEIFICCGQAYPTIPPLPAGETGLWWQQGMDIDDGKVAFEGRSYGGVSASEIQLWNYNVGTDEWNRNWTQTGFDWTSYMAAVRLRGNKSAILEAYYLPDSFDMAWKFYLTDIDTGEILNSLTWDNPEQATGNTYLQEGSMQFLLEFNDSDRIVAGLFTETYSEYVNKLNSNTARVYFQADGVNEFKLYMASGVDANFVPDVSYNATTSAEGLFDVTLYLKSDDPDIWPGTTYTPIKLWTTGRQSPGYGSSTIYNYSYNIQNILRGTTYRIKWYYLNVGSFEGYNSHWSDEEIIVTGGTPFVYQSSSVSSPFIVTGLSYGVTYMWMVLGPKGILYPSYVQSNWAASPTYRFRMQRLYFRISHDGGMTFGDPELILENLGNGYASMSEAVDGAIWIATGDRGNGYRYKLYKWIEDEGLSLETTITPSGNAQYYSPIYAEGEKIAFVYIDSYSGSPIVGVYKLVISTDNGVTWSTKTIVSDGGTYIVNITDGWYPVMCIADGNIIFQNTTLTGYELLTSEDDGDTWTPTWTWTTEYIPYLAVSSLRSDGANVVWASCRFASAVGEPMALLYSNDAGLTWALKEMQSAVDVLVPA